MALGGDDRGLVLQSNQRTYRSHLRQMIRRLKGKVAVWFGPVASLDREVHAAHSRAREVQKALLRGTAVRWVDSYPMTRSGHAPDGVHFTRDAYEPWARRVAREVAKTPSSGWLWPVAIGGAVVGLAVLWKRGRARGRSRLRSIGLAGGLTPRRAARVVSSPARSAPRSPPRRRSGDPPA